jgi:hypothetical protein
MSLKNVALSAGACDAWEPGEKDVFNGFYAMNTWEEFEQEFLTVARDGWWPFPNQPSGYWRDSRSDRKYDPQPTGPRHTWPLEQQLFAEWYQPKQGYNGEQLLGIFLHKIADAAVPSGHSPAGKVCDDQICEAAFEAMATQAALYGVPEPTRPKNVGCPMYDVAITSFTEPDPTEWEEYCGKFEEKMQGFAATFCADHSYCGATPNAWRRSMAEACYLQACRLANLLVPVYLLNTKEFRDAQPTTVNHAVDNVMSTTMTNGAPNDEATIPHY